MKKLVFLFIALFCASFLFAYVYGGSNLGFSGYPEFSDYPPSEPYSFNDEVSEYEFESYRNEVIRYVDAAEEYVENGNNDIKRISEAQDEAIRRANEAVDEFNAWARRVTVTSNW